RPLGEEPGQAANGAHEQDRVDEAVEVAGRDDDRSVEVVAPGDLDGAEEATGQEAGEERDHPVAQQPSARLTTVAWRGRRGQPWLVRIEVAHEANLWRGPAGGSVLEDGRPAQESARGSVRPSTMAWAAHPNRVHSVPTPGSTSRRSMTGWATSDRPWMANPSDSAASVMARCRTVYGSRIRRS